MDGTLQLRMTAGYYVDALMRDGATDDERRAVRALAVLGLKALKLGATVALENGVETVDHITNIPVIDAESFTV